MLIEEMYRLPLGTWVRSARSGDERLTGVVRSGFDGRKFVRWSDGNRTRSFGVDREDDEYIASHLRVDFDGESGGSKGDGKQPR